MKILMVCLGNICRSPLAEGILQDKALKAGLNWQIESAGTNACPSVQAGILYTGEPPHHLSMKVAAANGIDISKQRSRRFTADDFEEYDFIYAMANDVLENMKIICKNKFDTKKTALFLNEEYPGEDRDVPDPWSGPEKGYHEAFAIINKTCGCIIQKHSK